MWCWFGFFTINLVLALYIVCVRWPEGGTTVRYLSLRTKEFLFGAPVNTKIVPLRDDSDDSEDGQGGSPEESVTLRRQLFNSLRENNVTRRRRPDGGWRSNFQPIQQTEEA